MMCELTTVLCDPVVRDEIEFEYFVVNISDWVETETLVDEQEL